MEKIFQQIRWSSLGSLCFTEPTSAEHLINLFNACTCIIERTLVLGWSGRTSTCQWETSQWFNDHIFWPPQQSAYNLSVKTKQMVLSFLAMILKSFKCTTWQTSGPGMPLRKRQLYKACLNDCGCSQGVIAKASTKDSVLGEEGRR